MVLYIVLKLCISHIRGAKLFLGVNASGLVFYISSHQFFHPRWDFVHSCEQFWPEGGFHSAKNSTAHTMDVIYFTGVANVGVILLLNNGEFCFGMNSLYFSFDFLQLNIVLSIFDISCLVLKVWILSPCLINFFAYKKHTTVYII